MYSGARSGTAEQAVADGIGLAAAGFEMLDVGAVPPAPVLPCRRRGDRAPDPRRRGPGRAGRASRSAPTPSSPRSRARRRGRARPRSTTSAAEPIRCWRRSRRPAAATCSCTSRGRRGSTGRRPPTRTSSTGSRGSSRERIERAIDLGVAEEAIVIDPGLDFDLTVDRRPRDPAPARGAARARPAALRLALPQGLHRRGARRLLGGPAAGRGARQRDDRRRRAGGRQGGADPPAARPRGARRGPHGRRIIRPSAPGFAVRFGRSARRYGAGRHGFGPSRGEHRADQARTCPGARRSTRRGGPRSIPAAPTAASSPRAPSASRQRARCRCPTQLDPEPAGGARAERDRRPSTPTSSRRCAPARPRT